MKTHYREGRLIKAFSSSLIDPQEDAMKELRCSGTMHGRMTGEFLLEVKCHRRSCGAKKGVVVLHTFDVVTGELMSTQRYKEPSPVSKKGSSNGSSGSRTTVRSQGRQTQATRRAG